MVRQHTIIIFCFLIIYYYKIPLLCNDMNLQKFYTQNSKMSGDTDEKIQCFSQNIPQIKRYRLVLSKRNRCLKSWKNFVYRSLVDHSHPRNLIRFWLLHGTTDTSSSLTSSQQRECTNMCRKWIFLSHLSPISNIFLQCKQQWCNVVVSSVWGWLQTKIAKAVTETHNNARVTINYKKWQRKFRFYCVFSAF